MPDLTDRHAPASPDTLAGVRGVPSWAPLLGAAALAALALVSLHVGAADAALWDLVSPARRAQAWELLTVSRLPRTLALVLAGSSLAVSGLIMQLLTRNAFVEPATAGTMEFAALGVLGALILLPGSGPLTRMACGTLTAALGTAVFLRILAALRLRDVLVVPLVGIMLGGIAGSITLLIAFEHDLVQTVGAWTTGEFSAVLAGRYELLWIAGALLLVAVAWADRLTVAGFGEDVATTLGLSYRGTMAVGMALVSVTSAVVVVTVGMLPFIGLVVPNVVAALAGHHARRTLPWVAGAGAGLVLACDIVARLVVYPAELPIGSILGVLGGAAFLVLVLRRGGRHA